MGGLSGARTRRCRATPCQFPSRRRGPVFATIDANPRALSMATAAQERARLRAIIRSEDQALERALSSATRRTLSAVSKLVRSQERAGRQLNRAWLRPPPAHFRRQFMGGRGRALAGSGGRGVTFHFHLNQTYSGKSAADHQRYIEREVACVASFGNIADEAPERERVWDEIENRGSQRKGSFTIGAETDIELREAIIEQLSQWRDEERVPPRIAAKMIRMGAKHWPPKGLRIWSHDDDDHKRIATWFRQWEEAHDSQADEPEPTDDGEKERTPKPEQQELPGFEPVPKPEGPTPEEREEHAQKLQRQASRKRKLPRGCREFVPRRTTIQRRIILELAHELPLEAQERALRQWCEQELGAHGISYHAVIHQPEGQNDVRNWHAHIVYSPITLEREKDPEGIETGRYTFENDHRLPPMPTRLRELGGNGPQGRRGAGAIIKGWRQALADIQNTELRRVGANKRYDPRSYRDQGVDRVPGQHVGTKRAALETSGRAVEHWSHACPEWTRVMAMIENNLEEWQATDPERDGVYEAIEEVRLEMGAHTPEGGAHLRAWGLRVRASLRDEPRYTDIPEEGWQPQVLELTKTIRRIGRECTTHVHAAQWQIAWRSARTKLKDPLRLGAVADGIALSFPGDTEGLAADPRPEARAVGARARRFRVDRTRWIAQCDSALGSGPEALTKFARQLVRHAVPIDLVLGEARGNAVNEHIENVRRVDAMRLRIREVTKKEPGDTAAGIAQRQQTMDWNEAETTLGAKVTKAKRRECETTLAVTALREVWRDACESGAAGVRAFAINGVVHPQWPNDVLAQRRALVALGKGEAATMTLAQSDPEGALKTHRDTLTRSGERLQ